MFQIPNIRCYREEYIDKLPSTITLFHDKLASIAKIVETLELFNRPFIPSHKKNSKC